MPRPPKPRWVEFEPEVTWFVPSSRPAGVVDAVILTVDELEALRLKDVEGLEQEACAQRMNLAQSSFQRLLAAARQKVAGALVAGKAIQVSGGHYVVVAPRYRCGRCGHHWRHGEPCPVCGSTRVHGVPSRPGPPGESTAPGQPEAGSQEETTGSSDGHSGRPRGRRGGRGCDREPGQGRGSGRGRGRGRGMERGVDLG